MTTSSFSGHLLRAEKDSPYTGRRNYTVWPPAHDDINGSILGPREIALTFDDAGSHTAQKMIKKRGQNSSTLMLLDALDAAHISSGFFVNSDVDGQLLLSMAMRGHLVGSHADNHDRHFPDVPSANFSRVLRRVERVFMDWLHQKPVLIRAPFGEIDSRVLEILHERHYLHVGWNVISYDTDIGKMSDGYTNGAPRLVAMWESLLLNHTSSPHGLLVLLHDTVWTAKAMPRMIERTKQLGFRVVPCARTLSTEQLQSARGRGGAARANRTPPHEAERHLSKTCVAVATQSEHDGILVLLFITVGNTFYFTPSHGDISPVVDRRLPRACALSLLLVLDLPSTPLLLLLRARRRRRSGCRASSAALILALAAAATLPQQHVWGPEGCALLPLLLDPTIARRLHAGAPRRRRRLRRAAIRVKKPINIIQNIAAAIVIGILVVIVLSIMSGDAFTTAAASAAPRGRLPLLCPIGGRLRQPFTLLLLIHLLLLVLLLIILVGLHKLAIRKIVLLLAVLLLLIILLLLRLAPSRSRTASYADIGKL